MSDPISRRSFSSLTAGVVVGSAAASAANLPAADDKPKPASPQVAAGPIEAPFERDYSPPSFKPSWKKQQINRVLVQDFVIYAHSELDMVKKLLEKEPMLLNATMDWGGGDWETGLGGASHMGRRDIVEYLLERGARIDIFCAAMMGQLDAVKIVPHPPAPADRRPGTARVHSPLPRPGRRQGSGTRPRLPPVDQEAGAQADPIPQEASPRRPAVPVRRSDLTGRTAMKGNRRAASRSAGRDAIACSSPDSCPSPLLKLLALY